MRAFLMIAGLVVLMVATPAVAQEEGGGGGTGTGSGTSTSTGTGAGTSTSTGAGTSTGTGTGTGAGTGGVTQVHHHHHAPPPRSEEEGDGRAADLLWIEGTFGYSYVDLVQFSQTSFLPMIERFKGSGYAAGVAAGVRLSMLMIGARGTLASYEWFDFWTIGGEVHLRLPIGKLEPFVRAGVGYGFVGQFDYDVVEDSQVDVFGLVLDAGVGIDIYLDKIFAIGAGMDGAFLNLSRQRVDETGCPNPTCTVDEVNFREDGDAAGLQLRFHGHASLHF